MTPVRPLARHPREAEAASPRPSVLHVVHGWPPHAHGGTELYAWWLARWQARERATAVYTRVGDPSRESGDSDEQRDGKLRIRRVVHNFDQRNPLVRNALRSAPLERDFERFLDEVAPDLVHVHHLAGHALSLPGVAKRRGIRVVLQLQDWWLACARANLLDARERLCSGPGLAKCGACLPLTRRPPRALWNPMLYGLRRRLVRDVVASADACVAGSSLVVRSLRELGVLGEREVVVLPYGVPVADDATSKVAPSAPELPLRLGFVGSILPHKGLHVAAAAMRDLPAGRVTLDAWGDAAFDEAYARRVRSAAGEASLRLRGSFAEAARTQVLREMDVLLVPSLGLESFGLVAWEAMHCGVPVIASDRVPLAEPLRRGDCGAVYPAERTDELTRLLRELIAEPQIVTRWRANLPAVKGWAEHAGEVEQLYARALSARR